MKSKAIQLINADLEKKLVLVLVTVLIFVAFMYAYFVNAAVVNTVQRETALERHGELSSEVSSLEVKYMELKSGITLERAYSMGFEEAPDTKFVSRKSLGKTLTLNEN